jgi:PadR family transcriptional regulator, regulatory protein AphA
MELNPTAYVILGLLETWRPMSGYDVKRAVEDSTRFFWTASYGQIYPELRRLADDGLIEPQSRPEGGRKRTVYRITPAGREALREWLAEEPESFELRDDGLLKLFFTSASPEAASITLLAKRRHHEATAARLREIEATGRPHGFALMVLHYGIECHEWAAGWCERAEAELDQGVAERRVG